MYTITEGAQYIARDRRVREGRIVAPVTVLDIDWFSNTVRVKHPTRVTNVKVDRFLEHYRPFLLGANGSN